MPTTQPAISADSPQARFQALFEQHQKIVIKVASTYCRHAEDRRDLIQEISAHLWRAFPRYDKARSFSTWMYRIALNVAISFARRAGYRRMQPLALNDPSARTSTVAEAADELEDEVAALHRFIDRLGDLDRALLLLYLEERAYREIAEVLGISETNVATKISRLKQRIRKDFSQNNFQRSRT
jgi:RNA polymerase sigma-70 factor (ECF subfamily)